MGQFAIGQSVPRTEDPRLLRGEGRYVDDVRLVNPAHAYILRSPHAHARIRSIDTAAAKRMPGVLAVLTGDDVTADGLGWHQPPPIRHRRDGSPAFCPPHPALCTDKARYVGDQVAMVVADTLDQARDAAERIEVDYEVLPALVDGTKAREPGAPTVHDGCDDNESYYYAAGDEAAVDAIMAKAHHVTRLKTRINRISPNTMEPRAAIGDYDHRMDRYTLYSGTQRMFLLRQTLAGQVLHVPETQIRIMTNDVGGSFGMKGGHHPECHLVLWASKKVGRPVRWVADRSEGLQADYHDRDQVTEAAIALDEDGRFLAIRVSNICAIGGYLDPGGTISPAGHLGGLAGCYRTPQIFAEASAVFTNTACNGPFRGSGRPEASYVLERLVDRAARETGIDRAEIRRRNFVKPEDMPFRTGLLYTLDCGDFPRNQEQALEMAGWETFEDRRREAAERGRLRGIGIANFIEQTAQMDGETVSVRFNASGTVTVVAGSIDHGQGHDTMYKIVVSDRLGIDADDIRVAYGDSDTIEFGGGTYASRTAILGSSAASRAVDKVIARGLDLAAHMLEAAADDIEFADGAYRVKGTDRAVAIQEVAKLAYQPPKLPAGIEPGLFAIDTFAPGTPTFPNGCHVCEVEIDPETGRTEILRYSVVDDVGTVINALTLEGQIHGGIGQGVGQCLTEGVVYDEDGQLLTGSFLDYGMPRADDMCSFDCANNPVPTALNPVGAKGAGEAGNVGALAVIMNAIVDALSPLGIDHIDMPATPNKVWKAIREAGGKGWQ